MADPIIATNREFSDEEFSLFTKDKSIRYDFIQCKFRNVYFTNWDLIRSFQSCEFHNCTFYQYRLDIDASKSKFYDCRFNLSDFSRANFFATEIYGCKFVDTNLSESNFQLSTIKSTIFKSRSKLSAIKLDEAKLSNVTVSDCIIETPPQGLSRENITMGGATRIELEWYRSQLLDTLKVDPLEVPKPTQEEIDLIANYENIYTPISDQVTEWFGDYGMNVVRPGITERVFSQRLNSILSEIGISQEQLNSGYFRSEKEMNEAIQGIYQQLPEVNVANNFSKTIDDFMSGKINPSAQIFVCKTTAVMKACGADDLDVVINQSSIRKILSDDKEKFPHAHNLSVQELKQLPEQLQKPIMTLKGSHDNSMVLVTDILDINSREVLITVDIDTAGFSQNVNRITSMYGKDNITNYLRNQLDKGNLIGCDKKRANEMLSIKGLQLPPTTTFIDYTDIISKVEANVNNEISSVKQTLENRESLLVSEINDPFDLLQKKYPYLNLNQNISQLDGIPAIELSDGSIIPLNGTDRYPTHVEFIKENKIDVDDLKSGGWIAQGVYEASFQSDTERYIKQMTAAKKVAEKRNTPFNQNKFNADQKVEIKSGDQLSLFGAEVKKVIAPEAEKATASKGLTKEEFDKLNSEIKEIAKTYSADPELFTEFMAFKAQFYQYSPTNAMLIHLQNPYATFVASFTKWKEMGYKVKADQVKNHIKISRPIEISKFPKEINGKTVWTDVKYASPEEKAKIASGELEIKKSVKFIPHQVFDISQTNCPADHYPKIYNMGHPDIEQKQLYECVKEYAKISGFTVSEEDLSSISLHGYYNKTDDSIHINSLLEDSKRLETMCHELAHGILHKTSTQPVEISEFEAECFASMLKRKMGFPVSEESKRYISQYYNKIGAKNIGKFDMNKTLDRLSKAFKHTSKGIDETISNMGFAQEKELAHTLAQANGKAVDVSKISENFTQALQ